MLKKLIFCLFFLIIFIFPLINPCFSLDKEGLKNYLRHKRYYKNYKYNRYDYESDYYIDTFEYENCEVECFCIDWDCYCYKGECECECIDWDCDCY
ncbi:MAG: hypothetical protein MW689_000613 [Thermodesulfobacteria bacterium]|nr:hypothetical protein [Thermodesulfobacteriota bacterium]MCU4138824.1 hypothetical protein [Thermodesulfobacteriota bacterium]